MNIVVIRQDKSATLVKGAADDRIEVDGELFIAKCAEPDCFGFYDWLRTSSGDVIGVRLQLEDSSAFGPEELDLLCSLDSRNTQDELFIFFGSQRIFEAAMSDDTDFGGNILYAGEFGSLAISFNNATIRSGAAGEVPAS